MDTPPPEDRRRERAAAVVALKELPAAKSRMSVLPSPVRERLARCMALDTLAALAPAVDEVLVISNQADLAATLARHRIPARVIDEPVDTLAGPDDDALNRALAHADALLRSSGVVTVLACVGDLPALRTATVVTLLSSAAGHARSFLADHAALGTTMLIANGSRLDPRFGRRRSHDRMVGSAERHRGSGAHPLALEAVDARWDVDTVDDLAVVQGIGLGPATTAMVDRTTRAVGRYVQPVVRRPGQTLTVEVDGQVEDVPWAAYDGDPALIVPGRRLHAVRAGRGLSCWL